ncbi:hypothetical protein [Lentzea tibetensis]|uniref:hypothetical protein n=1 Tax=Lentzea tibetensis TaxID=2591470 RepID=UPI00164902AC|nr:hypothetical protein [Lentzea tibetensis]
MFSTRTLEEIVPADEADLVIYEFDRPTGTAGDLDLLAFTVHCGGPVIIGEAPTTAAA